MLPYFTQNVNCCNRGHLQSRKLETPIHTKITTLILPTLILPTLILPFLLHKKTGFKYWTSLVFMWLKRKYEHILLLARHILVVRIHIFKYDIFWLGVFSVLIKRRTLAYVEIRQNTLQNQRNTLVRQNTTPLSYS